MPQKSSSKKAKNKTPAKSSTKATAGQGYAAKHITVLEGLDPVRRRPGMYIGTTGPAGLHHLIWECLDNSIDEAMGGHADDIRIRLLPANRVEVRDNGRGIPVDKHPQFKVSALELVMTKLHAGGKFGAGGYKVSGGLHGVGVSVVNALSIWMKAEVRRDGANWTQEYKQGRPLYKVKKGAATREHGTTVIFEPDPTVFETVDFNLPTILDHVRQQAYLTKGVKIRIQDDRSPAEKTTYIFYFEGGVASYVKHLNHAKHPRHDIVFYVQKTMDNVQVETALQYTDEYKESVFSFANNIFNPGGGTHLVGFRAALTRVLNAYARIKGFLKEKDENLTGDDVREGLTAVISVKVPEPQFEGQTKDKLGNPEVRAAVESVFGDALAAFLEEHPRDAERILEKCVLAAQARAAAKAARDTVLRKGMLEGLTLPGKLADCSSRDSKESELFIVEGDSAGGCFSKDTKVALADGRALSFEELIEEQQRGIQNYCYTLDTNSHVAIALIKNVRRTQENAKVLKIILDNEEEIICTPDHKFRLTDGSYIEARKLTPEMSLAPLYRQISKIGQRITSEGHELVYDAADKRWIFTHLLSDAYNLRRRAYSLEQGEHRHHIDFNKRNNNYNHKVKAVIPSSERVDVYDLEVPETHNFALEAGVFVHNSSKQGRDRRTQAILPLRGKILNVERARIDKMLQNAEIRALIIALGTNFGEQFDLSKLRYDKIIIATDADTDGSHIRTLLLTLFYRYFPEIIKQGHLYIAQPPLYKIQVGKEVRYVYNDEQKEKALKEMLSKKSTVEKTKKADAAAVEVEKKANIQRYKGLGEMNPSELWETTMDPSQRVLKQVTIEDAEKADEIFDVLMGSEVAPRKRFIQTHAKAVKNLDI